PRPCPAIMETLAFARCRNKDSRRMVPPTGVSAVAQDLFSNSPVDGKVELTGLATDPLTELREERSPLGIRLRKVDEPAGKLVDRQPRGGAAILGCQRLATNDGVHYGRVAGNVAGR